MPNAMQGPPPNQPPATRVQQRLDGLDEPASYRESGTLRDPDAGRDSDPYAEGRRDEARYRDAYDDGYRAAYYDHYDQGRDDRYQDDYYDDRRRDEQQRERRREREPREERYDREPRMSGPSADTIGRLIGVFTGLIALIFVLHVIFVVTGANQDNGFVSFTYGTAKFFVFGLGDVFQPGDATIGVVLNYGLAALIYLFGGRIIARALKR
ncbi:hypothetical protein [Saccharopolyspora oryzae]|uniref:Uncharacterized protein n=1 Tax=Saccharopolyspora oryzae TaxID=2997343 RepID=A0ABT4V050_9PSEU|nr:hypothetical protein [Saccharopolyspora oryzae]MDA3627344.1 hypothetical protein [Saccharopolyspora oryzae]